jgi:putative acetyltransferase
VRAVAESTTTEVLIRALRAGEDASAFRTLNEEWITRHFVLEPKDVETLADPERTIVKRGGEVFFAEVEGEVVGCVALLPVGDASDGVFELSKMAVSPAMRGRGVGRKLLLWAVAEARRRGARRLFLGSSTKLANAVRLYESAGFEHVAPEQLPHMGYQRADVFMEIKL